MNLQAKQFLPFLFALLAVFFSQSTLAVGSLVAHYTFNACDLDATGIAEDAIAGFNGVITGSVSRNDDATSGVKPDTCSTANFSGGAVDINGLPLSIIPGANNSISFWMYWDGSNSVMPLGFDRHDLWFSDGSFGFNSAGGDLYGISSAGLANGWHHVAVVFTNNNLTQNQMYIDGVLQTLSQRRGSPNNSNAVVNAHLRIGGWWANSSYRFSGLIDEVKVYTGDLTQAQVSTDFTAVTSCAACTPPPGPAPPVLVAHYNFDLCDWESTGIASDSIGAFDGTITGGIGRNTDPTSELKPETCSSAYFGGGAIDIAGLPLSIAAGDSSSVSFWMNWDGTNSVMPIGFNIHDLWIFEGNFGFNTGNGDLYGISSAGLANGWHHVAVTFNNNNITQNQIFIDGVPQTLTQRRNTPINSRAVADPHLRIGGWWVSDSYRFRGRLDEVKVYTGTMDQVTVDADMAYVSGSCPNCPPPPSGVLIAEYTFDDNWSGSGLLTDIVGGSDGVISGSVARVATPAENSKPDSCFGADFSGGAIDINGLPVITTASSKTSVSFWMNWDGTNSVMPLGWGYHDLWFFGGNFGFNSASGDLYGISSAGLANEWHHIAVVFTNNNMAANEIYIDGVLQNLSQRRAAPNNSRAVVDPHLRIGGWWANNSYRFRGKLDELRVYNGEIVEAQVLEDMSRGCLKPVAQWLMDEPSWDNSSSDVLDNSGNANNGRAYNGATTTGNSCFYGRFDGINDYVQIPHSAELNGSDALTYMAWIRADQWSGVDQIIAKSVHGGGSGRAQMGLFSEGGVLKGRAETNNGRREVNTILPLVAGDWNHVALVFDGVSLTIYTDGNQVAQTTFAPTTLVQTTDPLNISKRVGTSQYYFDGLMDDVRVYTQAVSEASLNDIIVNTNLCPLVGADHFDIDHNNSAVFCAPTLVYVRAEDDGNNIYNTYTGTITVNTNSGDGNWLLNSGNGVLDNGVGDDGVATYVFDSADNGQVVFSLDYSGGEPAQANVNISVSDGSISDDDFEGVLNFSASGFTLSGQALVSDPPNPISITPIATQISGTNFPLYITAFGQIADDASCGIIESYQGAHNLTFSINYDDPVSGTVIPTAGGGDFSNSQTIIFSVGVAQVDIKYKDVGRISLNVSDGTLMGTSSSFVEQPAQFDIQLISNPGAAGPGGNVFIAAGNDFPVTVLAKDAEGDLTPNYGNEFNAESVALTHALLDPVAGAPGVLTGSLSKNGAATYTGDYQWNEVGVIELIASVADGDYLGVGVGSTTTTLSPVGRFTPNHFIVENDLLTPAINNFTYLDQFFDVEFDVRAVTLNGSTTTNYQGTYSSLSIDSEDVYGAVDNTVGVMTQFVGRITAGSVSPLWFDGVLQDITVPLVVGRLDDVDGPFQNAAVGLILVDDDNITLLNSVLNLDTDNTLAGNDRQQLGDVADFRYGRIVIPPVYGPEIPAGDLTPIPFNVQYWDGSTFIINVDDDGTRYGTTTTMSMVEAYLNYRDNLNSGEITVNFPVGSYPVINGVVDGLSPLSVTRPGVGNSGSVDVQVTVEPWLQFFWDESGEPVNPVSRINFGIYRGHDRIIYRQEVLQ